MLELINLGNHAAKKCVIHWEPVNIDNAKQLFLDRYGFQISDMSELRGNYTVDYPGQNLLIEGVEDSEIEYILQIGESNDNKIYIDFPVLYKLFIYTYREKEKERLIQIFNDKHPGEDIYINFIEPPKFDFKMSISYNDMLGNNYYKEYIIKVDYVSPNNDYFTLDVININ